MAKQNSEEGRGKQILVGAAILATLTVLVVGLLVGWRLIPGWVGESVGMVAGILSTPFFMEGSYVVIGLLIVLGLNTWRRRKEGDEFVEIETGGKDSTGNPDVK
ncbi:MAG: hypothetical protein IZT59_08850 [Verrucomicrobia bacterium]|jgi:hypothetical protein|nr:hypothetical protein [Verrucomicrobiota bacterium]|tara:strand:- start:6876 stop:7187 length:312 start_codon:yes stop_codon:yes gene_type:complete